MNEQTAVTPRDTRREDEEHLRRLVDAGIALAFSPSGTGIGAQWSAKLKSHVQLVDQHPTDTAAVTSDGVFFDRSFLRSLKPAEVVYLVAHETTHVALSHVDSAVAMGLGTRQETEPGSGKYAVVGIPGKEHELKLLNWAQDIFINEHLNRGGVGAMPANGFTLASLPKVAKQSAPPYTGPLEVEPIFEWLVDNVPPPKGGGKGGGGAGGTGQQPAMQGCAPTGLPGKMGKVDAEQMRAAIREAALSRPGKGSTLAEVFAPPRARVDWRAILRNAFETASEDSIDRSERSFARPARRKLPGGIIMPGQIGTEARIAVIIDVSGSVGEEWVALAVAYIERLQDDFPEVACWLGTHTDETVWSGVLKPGQDRKALSEATAFSGGTDCRDTYEKAAEAGPHDVLIHFTDCELPSWPKPHAKRYVVGVLCGRYDGEIPHGARKVLVQK